MIDDLINELSSCIAQLEKDASTKADKTIITRTLIQISNLSNQLVYMIVEHNILIGNPILKENQKQELAKIAKKVKTTTRTLQNLSDDKIDFMKLFLTLSSLFTIDERKAIVIIALLTK